MSSTDEDIKRIKFHTIMDNTNLLSTNALLFPSNDPQHGKAIHAYANQLIQNFRRSPNLDEKVKKLQGLDYSSIGALFSSNDIIQAILSSTKKMNAGGYPDDDDDYHDDDYNAEVDNGAVTERGLVESFGGFGLSPQRKPVRPNH